MSRYILKTLVPRAPILLLKSIYTFDALIQYPTFSNNPNSTANKENAIGIASLFKAPLNFDQARKLICLVINKS